MTFFETKTNLTHNCSSRHGSDIDIIGIHTMETPERSNAAENVAEYFKRVKASAHWNVDDNSRVRVVPDDLAAWTLPGANTRSLNIEITGYAGQTASDWADEFSRKTLEVAAYCAAEWVIAYGVPIRHLNLTQIRNGEKGFAGHVDVNRVYKKSTHWDPGPNFPWSYFLNRVKAHVDVLNGDAPTPSAPPADTRPRNADGSLTIAQDGKEGPQTWARWQEVLAVPTTGQITPELIRADQTFLNSVVARRHIADLLRDGTNQLRPDGIRGAKTDKVRQFWLRNAVDPIHQKNLNGQLLDFDGIWGKQSARLLQFTLNHATSLSRQYGRV